MTKDEAMSLQMGDQLMITYDHENRFAGLKCEWLGSVKGDYVLARVRILNRPFDKKRWTVNAFNNREDLIVWIGRLLRWDSTEAITLMVFGS